MSKGVLLYNPFGYRVPNSGFTGPGNGYKWRVYDTGTANLSSIYSDSALSSAATNPLVANSDGEFAATFVDDGTYDVALLDESDNVIHSVAEVRARVAYEHIGFNVTGKPAASAIQTFEATFAFTLLEDMSGSRCRVGTAPTDTAHVITVKKNGSSVNTFSTSTGQNDGAVAGSNAETSFAIGDTLTIVYPSSQDSTAADISVVLKVRED